MSRRLDRAWLVFDSVENEDHDRCVDLFSRPDGSFGFEEFRRDVEDRSWTPVHHYSGLNYPTNAAAVIAAAGVVGWFTQALERRRR